MSRGNMLAGTRPARIGRNRAPIQSMCSRIAARAPVAGAVETTVFDEDVTEFAELAG